MNKILLRCIVGSQAHGLAGPDSDFDYRGVFVTPTAELLKLGGSTQSTNWIEGREDDTSWELKHFLELAIHCNPTVLETFLAPETYPVPSSLSIIQEKAFPEINWGEELRALFPYVWNSNDVKNAFIGYSLNQQKKMLDNKDGRRTKFAAAYLRVLVNAQELLSTGTFTVKIADLVIGETIKRFKEGNFTNGEAIDICQQWIKKVEEAYDLNPDKKADLEPVNEFLLKVRKENWE